MPQAKRPDIYKLLDHVPQGEKKLVVSQRPVFPSNQEAQSSIWWRQSTFVERADPRPDPLAEEGSIYCHCLSDKL